MLLIMKSWKEQWEKTVQKKLYRCERLGLTKNPDYLNHHANEAREIAKGHNAETKKRILEELEKRKKDVIPTNSLKPVRMNRQK